MEQLDYLIRSLTYKRSCLLIEYKKLEKQIDRAIIGGQIDGIQYSLGLIYSILPNIEEK